MIRKLASGKYRLYSRKKNPKTGRRRNLAVIWTLAEDGRLALTWTETGGPPVTVPHREGFGTRLIGKIIEQSKGEIRLDWRPEGLVCEVAIPV